MSDGFPPVRLEVRNARQWRRAMKRAGEDMTEWKDIHRSVASTVQSAVNAPVGPSGRLSASVRSAGTVSAAIIRAGRKTVPYAHPIHWGWPARGIPATYFVTGPAKATEPTWTDLYWRRVTRILDRLEQQAEG